MYEYPYNKNLKSNYFVYNDKDFGDEKRLGGKRDYVFYEDKKCKIKKTIMCYKIDNPIYKIEYVSSSTLESYYSTNINKIAKEMIVLLISRKPADYELPLDNDNTDVLEDTIYFILRKNGKMEILRSIDGYYVGTILEKIK